MGHKNTPIGMIPSDWNISELGNKSLSTIIMGQSPPSSTYNKKIGLPFLQGKAEFGEINPTHRIYCDNPQKIAEKNDILISVRAPVGDVNLADDAYCIGRGLAAIRTKSYLDNIFLFYYLNQSKNRFESLSMGSTFKAIRKGELEKFIIPIPPLPEQKKIAEILSTIDRAIQKSDEIISKTERLKKGMMQKLLTEGMGHEEFKDTSIGRIPTDWNISSIGEISTKFVGGGTPATSQDNYWGGEIPWMTSAHITEKTVDDGQKYITKSGLKNSSTSIVPKNNLIIATRVGIGKVAINSIDIAINQDLTGIIIDNKLISLNFLYWYLFSNKNRLRSLSQGSTIKGILKEHLAKLRVPIPSTIEQSKISDILSQIDCKKGIELKKKEKFQNIKKGIMNDLLTGRKRVKIDN